MNRRSPLVVVALLTLGATCGCGPTIDNAATPSVTSFAPPRAVVAPPRRENGAIVMFASGHPARQFIPLLCVLDGAIATGPECAALVPPNASVVTGSGPTSLTRRASDFIEGDGTVHRAPHAPACCTDDHCREDTIPFVAMTATLPPESIVAWPDERAARLERPTVGAHVAARGPWLVKPDNVIFQSLTLEDRTLASIRSTRCRSCASFYVDQGSGWASLGAPGADGYEVLATTDVDGDGRHEAIVVERWRNGWGVFVLGHDWTRPAYRVSCGSL